MSYMLKGVVIVSIIYSVMVAQEMMLSFVILLAAVYIDVTLIDIKHILLEDRDKA